MPPGVQPDKSEPRYWNRLYRNHGDGAFSDVTEAAGQDTTMRLLEVNWPSGGVQRLERLNAGQVLTVREPG